MATSLAWTTAAALLGLPRAAGWPATLDTRQAAALQASQDGREAALIAATLADACQAGEVACEAGQRTVKGARRLRGYIGPAPIGARLQPAPPARTEQTYRVGPHAFASWLESQGLQPGLLVAAWAQAVQSMPSAPASAEPAPPALSPGNGPLPLSTGDVAHAFDGLRYSEAQWKKPLGDKPKWLQACVAIPGRRGVSETRWNPVRIGAALVQGGHVDARRVRAKFQTRPALIPWLDAWKTYEADYLESD
jgi:hypothetical protein